MYIHFDLAHGTDTKCSLTLETRFKPTSGTRHCSSEWVSPVKTANGLKHKNLQIVPQTIIPRGGPLDPLFLTADIVPPPPQKILYETLLADKPQGSPQ